MKRNAGVTLMELLIAVTLLSLLVAGVLTAMRIGLSALQKTNQRVVSNRKAVGAQRILEQQIAGLMPVSAECAIAGGQKIGFFQGEAQTMRFVSSYSLTEASRGTPRILEFTVIPGDQNQGYRLIVNEIPYTGSLGAGRLCLGLVNDPAAGGTVPQFVPVQAGPGSFVLADKLAGARFLYREILPPPLQELWVMRWVQPIWPSAIRVELSPLEADPSKITATTLTMPVFVNRVPMGLYVD
ncbi:MAG TPA: prepilin-type N-terminal cleavage/methylation domain-containing protein [Bryobacteraceae bacterium]|nr:prepilin-type N-terminal cleavage/methylation domain-containing protein [Bryobacteraceae bacterium]